MELRTIGIAVLSNMVTYTHTHRRSGYLLCIFQQCVYVVSMEIKMSTLKSIDKVCKLYGNLHIIQRNVIMFFFLRYLLCAIWI